MRSYVLRREVSDRELIAKFPSPPHVLEIELFQLLPEIKSMTIDQDQQTD